MMVWMTRSRITLVSSILAVFNISAILLLWLGSRDGLDYDGRAIGADFIAFWSAGWLALQDNIAAANGTLPFSSIHPLAPSGQDHVLLWNYPPPFLLLMAPLALLPYVPAMLVFVAGSLAAAGAALRTIWKDRLALILFLAAPATLLCVLTGQTGLLVGAAAASGLALRASRPWLAGLLLGALVIKPHFGALIPLFLLLRRDWTTLLAMALGALTLCLLSWAVFGPSPWEFFLHQSASARLILETGAPPWEKMGSAFVSARLLGAGTGTAWLLHLMMVALAAVLVFPLVRNGPGNLAHAGLLLLVMIAAPYQFDYDCIVLLAAIAFWVKGARGVWLRGEQALIALLWLGPVITVPLAAATRLGTLPLLVLAGIWLLSKRARTESQA